MSRYLFDGERMFRYWRRFKGFIKKTETSKVDIESLPNKMVGLETFLGKSVYGGKRLGESGSKGDARLRGSVTEHPPGIIWNPGLHAERAKQVGESQYNIDQDGDGDFDGNGWGYNLCGQIVQSIVLEAITNGELLLTDLFHALGDTKTTTGGEDLGRGLAKVINDRRLPVDYLVYAFDIKIHHTPNGLHDVYEVSADQRYTRIDSGYSDWMIEALKKGHYYMPLVNIDTKANGVLRPKGEGTKHWVLVTGFSEQWDYTNAFSRWNWIRIRNPFHNTEEYYWWGEFRLSVEAGLGVETWAL